MRPDTLPKPILMNLLNKAVESKAWSDEDIAIYEEKRMKVFIQLPFKRSKGSSSRNCYERQRNNHGKQDF